ncbi:MAG: tetratricopeptide repeat protein [Gammaproteobacteria bacterium]|nr:tetratricopeptide repeat protein [Gammaproteobacteria bacterium]
MKNRQGALASRAMATDLAGPAKGKRRRQPTSTINALLIVLLSVGVAWPVAAQQAPLSRAKALLQQGDNQAALRELRPLLESPDPLARMEGLNAQGWILYREGRHADASALFEQALRASQGHGGLREVRLKTLNNAGINAFSAGELDKARSYFEAALALGSDVAPRYLTIITRQAPMQSAQQQVSAGREKRIERDFEGAVADYTRALAIDPNNNDALSYRGYAYYRLGQYDRARADIEAALASSPQRLDALINLLKVSCASGDDIDAVLKRRGHAIQRQREAMLDDRELQRQCPELFASLKH